MFQVQLLNNLRVNVQEPVEFELSTLRFRVQSQGPFWLLTDASRGFMTWFHAGFGFFAVVDVGGSNRNI